MYELIGLIAIGVLIQSAEPILLLKRLIGFKEEDYPDYSRFKRFIHRGLYCCLCSSFWIALFYFKFNLLSAAIVAVSAEYIYQKIGSGL